MSEVLQYSNHQGGWGRHVLLCSTIKCSWNYSPARCWDTAAASGEVWRKIIIYLLCQYGKVTPVLYWSRMSHKSVLCSLWILWLLQKMMIHASWIWRIDIFLSSTDAAEIIDKVSSKINIIRLSWFSGMHIKVYPVYRMSHIICPSYSVLLGRMSYFCPYPFLQSFLFPVCCLFVFHLAQVCCLQLKRQLIAV